jgi:predicted ATPase
VAAATGQAAEDVEHLCTELARQGRLIQVRGAATWPDATVSTQFAFRHALYQEILYSRIPAGRRLRWHQQIGARLEAGYGQQAREIAAELAMHYVQGQMPQQAIQYLRYAGDNALRLSANQEAISLLTDALDILTTLPHSPQRDREELVLQSTLGLALLATKGFGALEVADVYFRARQLCQEVGEAPELTPVLWGLWWFHEVRSELQTAHELAQQLLAVSRSAQDSGSLLQAHRAMGQTLYWRGEFSPAQAHFEQGMALYDPQQHVTNAFLYGQDPGIGLRGFSALLLWHQGYPDQALARINDTLALAHDVAHPFSTAFALSFATWVQHYRGDPMATQAQAEAAMTLCREQGFAFFLAQQTILHGWALAAQGQAEEGIQQMRQGIAAYRATGAVAEGPYLSGLLAAACGKAGEAQEGLQLIEEALTVVQQHDLLLDEGELVRLKGELMLQQADISDGEQARSDPASRAMEAEACFHHALDLARQQQAKSWELRAATSLARLWQSQGKRQAAHDLLAPVYDWFTEGFDRADVQEAKALLEALQN